MLICIDARIAFYVIQYQILTRAMKHKESSKSKRRQEKPSKHTKKRKKTWIKGIHQEQNQILKAILRVEKCLCSSQPPR